MRILLLALFSINCFAIKLGSPQMLIQMLKAKQQKLNKFSCHEASKESFTIKKNDLRNRDNFFATIDCRIKCQHAKEFQVKIEKEFIPEELSLSFGDGSSPNFTIWRSLGSTLSIFKDNACYNEAENKCAVIDYFRAESLRSGNWKLQNNITCDTKNVVMSPFDPSFKLKQRKAKEKEMEFPLLNFSPEKLFQSENIKKRNLIQEYNIDDKSLNSLSQIKSCNHIIKVRSCFGDCIFDDPNDKNKFIETLSTPEPFGNDTYEICADIFIERIKSNSKEVSKFKCEKLVWEHMRYVESPGESCAAYRYNTNCSELL